MRRGEKIRTPFTLIQAIETELDGILFGDCVDQGLKTGAA